METTREAPHQSAEQPRPFGSVRMLPSGRFQARYRPRSGPHFTAPQTFDTEHQAQRWLEELRISINKLESRQELEALARSINANTKG